VSQDHLHQADRDYSAANEPNEDLLMQQLESAMLLADMFQGRRGVRPDGRGLRSVTPGFPSESALYVQVQPETPYSYQMPIINPPPTHSASRISASEYDAKLEATMAAFRNEPSDMGSVEIAILNGAIGVIREWVRRLRETGVGDTEVGTYACNSIDLGLVGLAKLAGKE